MEFVVALEWEQTTSSTVATRYAMEKSRARFKKNAAGGWDFMTIMGGERVTVKQRECPEKSLHDQKAWDELTVEQLLAASDPPGCR